MEPDQRALIVRVGPEHTDGLEELNIELQRGWRVAEVAPLGGTGLDESGEAPAPFLAALVIIERSDQQTNDPMTMEAVEEITEVETREPEEVVREVVEEAVEENGA
jgi:hypothetical protein